MSVQLRTGPSTDIWTVDPTSLAGRGILYDASGNVISIGKGTMVTNRTAPLVYRYVLVDVAGQTGGAYTWISLNNPNASGKNIALLSAEVQVYGVTNAATKNSTAVFQTTTAPAGGAADTTNIARLLSSQAAPVATITITNPASGLGKKIKVFAPGGVNAAAGIYSSFDVTYQPLQEDYQFIALPSDQGFALRQVSAAGDVDQTYCFSMEWMEYTP